MTVIEIKHGGVRQSLAAWGIEPGAILRLGTGGAGGLSFKIKGGSFAPSTFTAGGQIELFDADGTRRFLGIVSRPAQSGRGSEIAWTYHCATPNQWLEGRQFGQEWKVVTTTITDPTVEPTYGLRTLSIARLGKDTTPATIVAAVAQISDAGAMVDLDETNLPGGTGGNEDEDKETETTPENVQRSLTCLGVIRELLALYPYWDFVWDYDSGGEGGAAVMKCFSALRTGHGIGSLPATPWAVEEIAAVSGAGGFEEFEAEAMHELLISKLTIQFIEETRVQYDGNRLVVGKLTAVEATMANGAFRQETHAIVLRPAYYTGTSYVSAEQPMLGLANQLGAAFFHLPHVVKARKKDGTGRPVWSLTPGRLYNFIGATDELETAYALLRDVSYNLTTGDTACEWGPPTQVGIGTIADVLRKVRDRKPATADDAGSQTYGFKPDDNPTPGGELVTLAVHVKVGDDYLPKLVNVKGDPGAAADTITIDAWVGEGAAASDLSGQKTEVIGVNAGAGALPVPAATGESGLTSNAGTAAWTEIVDCGE